MQVCLRLIVTDPDTQSTLYEEVIHTGSQF